MIDPAMSARLDRLEAKLDALIEAFADARRESAVHAAVCDTERAELVRDIAAARASNVALWKVALGVVAGSGATTGLIEGLLAVV